MTMGQTLTHGYSLGATGQAGQTQNWAGQTRAVEEATKRLPSNGVRSSWDPRTTQAGRPPGAPQKPRWGTALRYSLRSACRSQPLRGGLGQTSRAKGLWWSGHGSNVRPVPCKGTALPLSYPTEGPQHDRRPRKCLIGDTVPHRKCMKSRHSQSKDRSSAAAPRRWLLRSLPEKRPNFRRLRWGRASPSLVGAGGVDGGFRDLFRLGLFRSDQLAVAVLARTHLMVAE